MISEALATAALALATAGWAAEAPGEEDPRSLARVRLDEGSALYERGDHKAALEKFEEAYAIYPSPKIHFNRGLAHHAMSRTALAVEWFERFLAEAADAAPGPRAQAEKLVAELRPKIARVEINCDRLGAEVSVDGRSYGATPLARPALVEPGSHQVLVQKAGFKPFAERFEATPGERLKLDTRLEPEPPVVAVVPPPPAEEPPPSRVRWLAGRWWFWASVAAVAAAGVGAAVVVGADPRRGSLGWFDARSR